MAMDMKEGDVKKDFESAFGIRLEDATPDMIQFIADCGRHIRGRCRSNTALVNWLNSRFPSIHAKMETVEDNIRPGNTFETLKIRKLVKGVVHHNPVHKIS